MDPISPSEEKPVSIYGDVIHMQVSITNRITLCGLRNAAMALVSSVIRCRKCLAIMSEMGDKRR